MFRDLKEELQTVTVPSPPSQFHSINNILTKMGYQLDYPLDYSTYADKESGRFHLRDIISLQSSKPEHTQHWQPLSDVPMNQYPSSLAMDPQVVSKKIPVLSAVVDERDLYDPSTGIMTNFRKKGFSWERPCFISYYDGGELLFATGAGVRIHGLERKPPKVWPLRFYFRDLYGYDQFKPGVLFSPESVPLRQIIARREPNFRSMLAMDIAEKCGCLVPDRKPAMLYLNGAPYGDSYVLVEHLNDKWLHSRYGHDNYVIIRTTGHHEQRKNNARYQKLLKWANDKNIRMTMEEVGKRVDIDNLSRWFLSQFYTAGYDMYQGPLVLDRTKPDAKWFWINWDMDAAFTYNKVEPEKEHVWEKENCIRNVMLNPVRDRKNPKTARYQNEDPRAILFRRMHQEDINYRVYFERLFMEVMNHKLSPRQLDAWYNNRYREIMAFQPSEKSYLEKQIRPFITHRSEYLRGLMQKYIGSEKSFSCAVEGIENTKTIIDGIVYDQSYKGWYFNGATISVAPAHESDRTIDHWLINDRIVQSNGRSLIHTINGHTVIRPVFKNE
jgi:hypothetical protein